MGRGLAVVVGLGGLFGAGLSTVPACSQRHQVSTGSRADSEWKSRDQVKSEAARGGLLHSAAVVVPSPKALAVLAGGRFHCRNWSKLKPWVLASPSQVSPPLAGPYQSRQWETMPPCVGPDATGPVGDGLAQIGERT